MDADRRREAVYSREAFMAQARCISELMAERDALRAALGAISAEARNLDERDGIPGVAKESPETNARVTRHFADRMGRIAAAALLEPTEPKEGSK